MGTVFALPWTVLPDADTDSMISLLHRNGFKSVAMALTDNAVNVDYLVKAPCDACKRGR